MLQKLLAYTFYKIFFDFIISEEGYFLVMIYGISNPFWFVLFQVLFIQEALLINQEIVCVTITYKESKAKINIYHRMISCIILLTLLGTSNRSRKRSSIFFQQQSPAKQCKCVAAQVRNIWVFSPLIPSKREKNILVLLSQFCSVCIFFEGSVFTFQFLNDKIHNYVKKITMIVNFIIQKLKTN